MSAAETEVSEAIVESEEPSFDMDAAVDELSKELFPTREKKEIGYDTDKYEEVEEEDEGEKAEEETEEVAEAGEEEPKPEPEKPEEEVEKKDIPQSWKKDMQDRWDGLDTETQDYIELREKQMREGIDVKKEDADLGMRMRDAFQPFNNVLKQNNVDPVVASQKLMAAHLQIINAPPEQKKQLLSQLAQSYGITDGEPVDPKYQRLEQELNQVKQTISASQQVSQQENQRRIETEVESFASENPHFDDLSDEIAHLIRADYSLEDAYKVAYRASHFYDKDIEKKQQEDIEKADKAKKQEAEKAKKAKSVNVRGRDTSKAPTAPIGTMDDTMREVMREIKNRN